MEPIDIQVGDVVDDLRTVRDRTTVLGDYVVDGKKTFDGWFLAADKLIFKPGSALIFSRKGWGQKGGVYIAAKQIVVEDPGNPGTITYEFDGYTQTANTVSMGQAASGAGGSGNGGWGGNGSAGATGVTGEQGSPAPALKVFVLKVPGSGPAIDFMGEPGGPGSKGQAGGNGGNGGVGTSASQDAFSCRRGGENGGRGGDGGNGGKGGNGGVGGRGADVTFVTTTEVLQFILEKFAINIAGGKGGDGGAGGDRGAPGAGGPGGADARPHCGGGSTGPSGNAGAPGSAGEKGQSGPMGNVYVLALSEAQLLKGAFGIDV